MARLNLTLSCWDYDRTRALIDGSVKPDGIELNYLPLPLEETFFRMVRYQEFDCSEMSLSSYAASLNSQNPPFIAIPVFVSRFFRHSCIFVSASSRISHPDDLKGKRVGAPEYQMTAPLWIRGILSDDYGVRVTDYEHWCGGEEQPGREEKVRLSLPDRIKFNRIPPDKMLAHMLVDGEIDALFTARAPSTFYARPDRVKRLFPNYPAVEQEYYRRTKIFPPMHAIVIRRDVYERNRWIAQSLYKAFAAAKDQAIAKLCQTAALPAMLPWLTAEVEEVRREMGDDWWPYGLAENHNALKVFLRYHYEQGLSKRLLTPEELFAPETLEAHKI